MSVNSWGSDDPAQVAKGMSGRATTTAYAAICGGTTTTAAHQSITGVGTSGQVLTSNGAAALPTFQSTAGMSNDWTLITTVTTTSGSSHQVTSGLGTAYEDYLIIIDSVKASAITWMEMALSDDGGSSYAVELMGYALKVDGTTASSLVTNFDASNILWNLGNSLANALRHGYVYFSGNKTSALKMFQFSIWCNQQNACPHYGVLDTISDIDAIEFSVGAGVFDGGDIKIYGR